MFWFSLLKYPYVVSLSADISSGIDKHNHQYTEKDEKLAFGKHINKTAYKPFILLLGNDPFDQLLASW